MPLQNKIKALIDSRKITVYQFKKETKIAVRTAYDLYNCPDHIPSPQVLLKICETYKVQPGDILKWYP